VHRVILPTFHPKPTFFSVRIIRIISKGLPGGMRLAALHYMKKSPRGGRGTANRFIGHRTFPTYREPFDRNLRRNTIESTPCSFTIVSMTAELNQRCKGPLPRASRHVRNITEPRRDIETMTESRSVAEDGLDVCDVR
jgi:hypothetical protein